MKKLVLFVLVLIGLNTAGLFATLFTALNYGYTSFLILNDQFNNSSSGGFLYYYDENRKSMAIQVNTLNSGTWTYLYLFENNNPKLFQYIKEAIDKHINLRATATGPNVYSTIRFWYNTTTFYLEGFDLQGS